MGMVSRGTLCFFENARENTSQKTSDSYLLTEVDQPYTYSRQPGPGLRGHWTGAHRGDADKP